MRGIGWTAFVLLARLLCSALHCIILHYKFEIPHLASHIQSQGQGDGGAVIWSHPQWNPRIGCAPHTAEQVGAANDHGQLQAGGEKIHRLSLLILPLRDKESKQRRAKSRKRDADGGVNGPREDVYPYSRSSATKRRSI